MSRPGRRGNNNTIRGPQSALTDFLASHNISAQQISLDYQNRIAQAQRDAADDVAAEEAAEAVAEEDAEDIIEQKKRKRKEEKAIAKIKASKEFKRRKFEHSRDNPGEDDDSDAVARALLNKPGAFGKAAPKPGQLAHCELCDKRFTVTAYTLAGPDGSGLLCTKCGKAQKDEQRKTEAADKKAQKKTVPKARRRQTESDKMMGDAKPGAKSLVEYCVRKIANVVNDIEEFGDMPQSLLERLSQILNKNRGVDSRTISLFVQPGLDRIAVYDCARLETEDFGKILAYMPELERVNFRMAGQLKNENLEYMIEKNPKVTHLQLGGTNLVADAVFQSFFKTRGEQLLSLKLSELNDSFNDETFELMVKSCPNLERLKLRRLGHLTEASITMLSQMTSLRHLTLKIVPETPSEILVTLITSLGPSLQTLCLESFTEMDDTVLRAIHKSCHNLTKLRLTESAYFTDSAFSSLFKSWDNPSLIHVDLSSNRDLDPSMDATMHDNQEQEDYDLNDPLAHLDQDGNKKPPVVENFGFSSLALKSLLAHSSQTVASLDLHSNRSISHSALLHCFDGTTSYPELKSIDLSFVTNIDEVVMQGIFKSCPKLEKLAVFACFNAKSVRVPVGVAVIGLPGEVLEMGV